MHSQKEEKWHRKYVGCVECAAWAFMLSKQLRDEMPRKVAVFFIQQISAEYQSQIFRLPAEKMWVIQVRFLNINGKKKFRVGNSSRQKKTVFDSSRANEVWSPAGLFLYMFSTKLHLITPALPSFFPVYLYVPKFSCNSLTSLQILQLAGREEARCAVAEWEICTRSASSTD